jgi:hypothetical protein
MTFKTNFTYAKTVFYLEPPNVSPHMAIVHPVDKASMAPQNKEGVISARATVRR